MYKLRQTFDQIAKLKKKTVSVNTENLPKDALQRMVEEAISSGTKVTPVGSLKHAMKMAGYTSGEIKKAYRRWEHALFPGSYESAPMGPTRIR